VSAIVYCLIVIVRVDSMKVIPVPCEQDNYAYLVIDEDSKQAAVVDPVNPSALIAAAEKEGVKIIAVITTHHHWDHAGGNEEIVKSIPGLKVYGGDDRINALTNKVGDGDTITIGSIKITVYFTPCHTKGHVLYFAQQEGAKAPAIFTGDTLFIAGCGRFFEGDAKQMHHALNEVITSLPHATLVYCGHEYTVANLKFAKTVDPKNQALLSKLEWAEAKVSKKEYTVPSTIAEELTFNPFMRVTNPDVIKNVGLPEGSDPVKVMHALREAKNNFKG